MRCTSAASCAAARIGWGKLTGLAGFATDKFARPEPF
jgi:hypothetical protein